MGVWTWWTGLSVLHYGQSSSQGRCHVHSPLPPLPPPHQTAAQTEGRVWWQSLGRGESPGCPQTACVWPKLGRDCLWAACHLLQTGSPQDAGHSAGPCGQRQGHGQCCRGCWRNCLEYSCCPGPEAQALNLKKQIQI